MCAYLEREAARAHAEAAREAREAQAAWRALIRATLTRARVHAVYGGEHQGAAVTSTHPAEEGSTPAGGIICIVCPRIAFCLIQVGAEWCEWCMSCSLRAWSAEA